MIHALIDLALKYRILVLVFFMGIIVMGIRSYQHIPVDAFPDITPKQVVIYTESPGNSAEEIEKLVTYPIESALSGMAGVKSIMSNSVFGLSSITVFFEDNMDIYFLRQQVSERLSMVDIPKEWGKPILGPNTTGLGQVFWYQIYDKTDRFSLSELRQLQEYVVAPLYKSVSGVEDVIGLGGFEKQYDVLIDTHKLQNFDITYEDVVNALEKSNTAAGGQYLEFNQEQYIIRGIGLYTSMEDIRNTPIKALKGDSITIADVAEVNEGTSPRFGATSIDGKEAVMGMVLQRTQTNAAKVVELLKDKTASINEMLPKGVSIRMLYDRTEITHKAVKTMDEALIIGMVLVGIVLFLFLFELRSAFIVIVSLPVSLLIAFLLMDYYGMSANLMSLSGLAIAIGMIVDGTVVIVENSFRRLHDHPNASHYEIIASAAKEVSTPVTFAVLIIATVFLPLFSLDGLAGKLYVPMALNITFVMLGSLLVALVLVPVLATYLLKPTQHQDNAVMRIIKKYYTPLLDFALSHAKSLLIGVSIVFALSIVLLTLQGREFMPKLNEESIMYRVTSIPGTGLSQTSNTAQEIERFILKYYGKDVQSVLSMIGRSEKGEPAQANYMEVLLILKPDVKNYKELSQQIDIALDKEFSYVQFTPTQPIAMRIEEMLEGVKAELAIKIYGEDQKTLDSIATKIQETIGSIRGIKGMEIESQLGQAQIKIEPDYAALSRYGLSVDEIMHIIRYGIGEEPVTTMIEGMRHYGIVPKIKDAKIDIETLKSIPIRSQNGNIMRLDDVCHIETVQGPSFIKRENMSRYMVISLDVEGRDIASFVQEADGKISKEIDIPNGCRIGWAGDFKNMQEATQKLMVIIPITLIIIVLLLYMAFNSLSKAGLILLSVPFGLIGGIVALVIGGIYLSVSAIVGFIAIFAIAVLNGIVLVSFIDEMRLKFPDVALIDVVKNATLLRLRPVLMTASTALFGIIPLLFATGVGSEIHYPLAVVVTGGIISSTILTLLILPSTYWIFFRKKE